MKNLILSGSGRALTLAFGVALAGSGVGKLMDGAAGIAVSSLAVIFAVALSVVALVTATTEHFAAATVAVITLPWLLFLGEIGCGLLPPTAAGPLVIAGFALFAFAARRRAAPDQHAIKLDVIRSA